MINQVRSFFVLLGFFAVVTVFTACMVSTYPGDHGAAGAVKGEGRSFACSANNDCPRGYVCTSGTCAQSYTGTVCQSDYDCTKPNYCILGTCRPLGNAGEPCGQNIDCFAGMICSGSVCTVTVAGSPCKSDQDCNPPNYCILNYCQPLSGEGGYCAENQDCLSGLNCVSGICASATSGFACNSDNDCIRPNYCILGYCRPLSKAGGVCQYNYDCEVGMICSGGTCLVTQTGSPCNHDNDCNPPNYCIVGQCRPLSNVGGVCGQDIDCLMPLVCSGGQCVQTGTTAYCQSDAQCTPPYYCIVGQCRPLSNVGGVCAINGDCLAGLVCSGSVCVKSVTGNPCIYDADCAPPDYCIVGQCRPLQGIGGVCAANQDCVAGLVCQNGACVQSVTGTPCSVDADCSPPDYCIVGYCRPLQNVGGICSVDIDCLAPLICISGVCTY